MLIALCLRFIKLSDNALGHSLDTSAISESGIGRCQTTTPQALVASTFRATGITAYLKNSGKLEVAQHIASHESPRTTTGARTRFRSTKLSG
jgi:hypothetical protein